MRHASNESRGQKNHKQSKCVVISTMDKSRRWKVANTHLRAESQEKQEGCEYSIFLENRRIDSQIICNPALCTGTSRQSLINE